ncbi:MAG TPA: TetR/AcrR family transcriptional regulator [Dehalococcoidia bacterium]|nr:TetR/AcrR family transcriptional regulator [Dehalococcoidia bacterium]
MPKVLPAYLEQRRKQILESAAACFFEKGFHQTSMQDICERADLSPGAVYRYFRSKDDIIAAICDEANQQDLALIEAITAGGDAVAVLEELGRTFLNSLTEEDVRGHVAMVAEAPHSPHIRATARRGAEAITAAFARFVEEAQARGEVNPGLDPEGVAQVMCALYQGFVVQRQVDPAADPVRFFRAVMTIFREGFFTPDSLSGPASRQIVSQVTD